MNITTQKHQSKGTMLSDLSPDQDEGLRDIQRRGHALRRQGWKLLADQEDRKLNRIIRKLRRKGFAA